MLTQACLDMNAFLCSYSHYFIMQHLFQNDNDEGSHTIFNKTFPRLILSNSCHVYDLHK